MTGSQEGGQARSKESISDGLKQGLSSYSPGAKSGLPSVFVWLTWNGFLHFLMVRFLKNQRKNNFDMGKLYEIQI